MRTIFVYITNPSKRVAKNIAKHLLEKKLNGCANIFPMESAYWWQGRIENAKEYVLICKSLESEFAKLTREVAKIHPYTVPCIAKINVRCNEKFANWLKDVLD